MSTIARWANSYPAAYGLLSVSVFFLIFLALGANSQTAAGQGTMGKSIAAYASDLPVQTCLAIGSFLLILAARWSRRSRLTTPIRASGLVWTLPTVALTTFILAVAFGGGSASGSLSGSVVWKALLLFLLVGVFEEFLFRGLLMEGLFRRFGPTIALFGSAVIFGSMHFVNFFEGQPLAGTAVQVVHATASGILYGAIVLRTGSIWPAVALHAGWDTSLAFSAEMIASPSSNTAEAEQNYFVTTAFIMFDGVVGLLAFNAWRRSSASDEVSRR